VKTVDRRLINQNTPEGQALEKSEILQDDDVIFAIIDLIKNCAAES